MKEGFETKECKSGRHFWDLIAQPAILKIGAGGGGWLAILVKIHAATPVSPPEQDGSQCQATAVQAVFSGGPDVKEVLVRLLRNALVQIDVEEPSCSS